jgi:TRAP-type C4-dicarboxylate transport system permease small subunit
METGSEIIEVDESKVTPLERWSELIIVPMLLFIIALGFAAVCLRFFFGGQFALFWAEEVIRYTFIWMFWLCAPILVWRGAMFSVDVLTSMFPVVVRKLITIAMYCGITFLAGNYVWRGWEMTAINAAQKSSALQIPLSWIYISVPFGCALIVIICLIKIGMIIANFRKAEVAE